MPVSSARHRRVRRLGARRTSRRTRTASRASTVRTCYEHEDPRRGLHKDWDTLIFNYGRPEVKNFLVSNALFWLEEFHFDGLRVDAVTSMLYRDYSRDDGEWIPNEEGGNEDFEAIAFVKELNEVIHEETDAIVIAEESATFPGLTKPARRRWRRLRPQVEHGLDA